MQRDPPLLASVIVCLLLRSTILPLWNTTAQPDLRRVESQSSLPMPGYADRLARSQTACGMLFNVRMRCAPTSLQQRVLRRPIEPHVLGVSIVTARAGSPGHSPRGDLDQRDFVAMGIRLSINVRVQTFVVLPFVR